MKIFGKKLTNRSLLILKTLMEAVETKNEMKEILMCLIHSKMHKYAKKEGMTERFGTRAKMSDTGSYILQAINGMADEIESLKTEVAKHEKRKR
ncbi:hypothetical protein [Mariniphaga sediminis]|uniref:hypothetical protein n=1 Tax=Mariniphaga sediminis TaxID=1628158 RepID=UPI00356A4BBF